MAALEHKPAAPTERLAISTSSEGRWPDRATLDLSNSYAEASCPKELYLRRGSEQVQPSAADAVDRGAGRDNVRDNQNRICVLVT
jgi:hypothetical protein